MATNDRVDPVAGLAAHYRIDYRWFVNAQADIGGLDNNATGPALGSVGYNRTPAISTTLGYRVLYTYDKQDTGGTAASATCNGCPGLPSARSPLFESVLRQLPDYEVLDYQAWKTRVTRFKNAARRGAVVKFMS